MSSENYFLVLRLEGPLQSWGFDSQYNRRNTGLIPTKSAIAGMCCAALGYSRGNDEEKGFLVEFAKLCMTAIAIPRKIEHAFNQKTKETELMIRRLQDYHTVKDTRKASGGIKECHITHRQYLTDAAYGVLLEGEESFLRQIADSLADPVWGLWFGRKACIPTAPVLCGLRQTRTDALSLLNIDNVEKYTRQEDVENFLDGIDSLPDSPISFESEKRTFSQRRIKTTYAKDVHLI